MERKRFPDGEMYVRVLSDVAGREAFVLGNTNRDDAYLELLLTLDACRENGASRVIAVVPYFGYARQHMVYKRGEAVSSKVMTLTIGEFADRIITVEIHDEMTLKYSKRPFMNVSVYESMSAYYSRKGVDLVVSPDDGGLHRAEMLAKGLECDFFAINKKRIDSRTVSMEVPNVDVKGKRVLLVDDIISTGGTIAKAASLLRDMGASSVYVTAVHGVFANNSVSKIQEVVDEVAVTNTIEGIFSKIDIAPELASAMEVYMDGRIPEKL